MPSHAEQTQVYCNVCRRPTLHTRNVREPPHVMHCLITLFSCGLWAIVWIIDSFATASRAEPFRCTQCGQPAGYFTPEQAAPYQRQQAVEEQTKQRHLAEIERGRRQRKHAAKMQRQAERKALGTKLDQTLRSICGEGNDILLAFVQGFVWILIIVVPLLLAVVAAGWIITLL